MKYIINIKIRYNCTNSVIKLLHKMGFERRYIVKVLQAELPDKLYEQIKLLIDAGWFQDEKSVCSMA